MNKTETNKTLLLISTIWSFFEVTEERKKAWELILHDMPYQQATLAIMNLAKTSKFPPSPAELIESVSELTGTKRMSASEAWLIARDCCSRYVTREQLDALQSDIRKALNDAGRASYLGTLSEDQARKSFMGAWNALGDMERKETVHRLSGGLKQIGG